MNHIVIWTNKGHGDDQSWYRTVIKLWREYRIHIFWRGDTDESLHDHPNDFRTFPLIGYWEEVFNPQTHTTEIEYVKPFRWHHRPAEYRHRVLGRMRECMTFWDELAGHSGDHVYRGAFFTLIQQSKDRRKWGFWPDGKFVYWRDYLKAQNEKA